MSRETKSIYGKGFDFIIIDDYMCPYAEPDSQRADKIWDKYKNVFLPVSKTKVNYILTVTKKEPLCRVE